MAEPEADVPWSTFTGDQTEEPNETTKTLRCIVPLDTHQEKESGPSNDIQIGVDPKASDHENLRVRHLI